MSQYSTGTVTVTNGSTDVVGVSTAFVGNALAGHSFKIAGENVDYQVSVDATNDLALTISPAYAGSTKSGASFIIQREYTSLGIPEIAANDADWAFNLTRGLRKVDSLVSGLLEGYATVGNWNAATNSPTIPTAVGNNGKRYIVTTPGATLIDGAGPWGIGDSVCSNGTVWFRVPAAVAMSAANASELTGSANSILHFHATDRDLANATGLLPASQITQDATRRLISDAQIATWNSIITGDNYKGLWNATTNTPALPTAAPANSGWWYRVSVAGGAYSIGDVAISNGTTFERMPSGSAPTIHGEDHLTGGADPIPLATLADPGLLNLTIFDQMFDRRIRVSDTLPADLPVGGIWIDSSTTVRFNPSIAALLPQSWLYSDGATIAVFIDDVQDVDACTLAVLSSNSADMPATEPEMVFSGTGGVRTLTIAALAAPASSTLTLIVTNAYGLTSQIAFNAVAGAQMFTITTSAGANGSITTTTEVIQGGSVTITATPDSNYLISQMVIDGGTPITGIDFYTFDNVQANHTVSASFEMEPPVTINTFTIGTPLGLNTQVTAITDTRAVAYKITESATPPLAGDAGWSATKPTNFTASGAGSITPYPWAKDINGNVSAVFATPPTATFAAYPVAVPNGAVIYSAAVPLTALVANSGTLSQTAADTIAASGGAADNNFAALRTAATGQIYTRELEVTARSSGTNRTGYTYICPTSFTPAVTDIINTFLAAVKFVLFLGNSADANDGKAYIKYVDGAGTSYFLQSGGTWSTGLYLFPAPTGNPRFKVQKDATNYTVSLLNGDGSLIKAGVIAIASVRNGTSDDYLVFGDPATDSRNVMTFKVRS